ncbi:hypothetical protein J5U21_00507 [Saccharolobus shibatae]|uniref:Uncharacterized protein n=1 Tax=Saccharolobus shibatae TaxID=2286 RepID=A0A8F5BSV0_9CREN|nr:hypothetical protein J5U21_00507 [Saccharolobus shibatae]
MGNTIFSFASIKKKTITFSSFYFSSTMFFSPFNTFIVFQK